LLIISLTVISAGVVSAQTVYITKSGQKYHTSDCRYLSHSKIAIELKEAIQNGYDACSVCNPPVSTSSTSQPLKSESKSSSAVQCAATTRAGTRCKRMTKSPNGYCWQHGGN
jgi:hypothetical protein